MQTHQVKVYVLTFDFVGLDYELLNAELESKWFQGQDKSIIKIIHWINFLVKFAQDHEDVLTQEQKLLLKKETKKYKIGGKDIQSVLMIIAEILNKSKKKVIIMVDELLIPYTCKISTTTGEKKSYEVDFMYLSQYKNVHFILWVLVQNMNSVYLKSNKINFTKYW